MKKIIIIMLLAMFTMVQAVADTRFITQGDTTIIIDGQDTVRFMGVNALTQKITSLLDDTIVNLNEDGEEADVDVDNAFQTGEYITAKIANTTENIAESFFIAVVFIVALSLLFYYLHRRRKYKMVEKAIENNYPLPGYILGAKQEPARNVYMGTTPPPPMQGTPLATGTPSPLNADNISEGAPSQSQGVPQGQQPQYQVPPMMISDHINWSQMKDGFTTAAVGVGLMLFFTVVGAPRLACIFIILILLGVGKMWVNYQDQKNAIDWARRQQTWYGQQPPMQPQRPVQPQQPPVFNQPETKPTSQPQPPAL